LNKLPKGQGILFVLKGAGVGSRFLLDATETKIGRDINNEIHLDDITVSRSHALITKNDGYRIKDLGSLNGTYLNAIAVRDAQIQSGDEVQIGKFHLTLFIGDK
jgi:pSer/pThr/pTyr-binding forkhead associated (FHA) protein